MSQPTLSRQIQNLEQKVGTPLFVRGTHGRAPELTEGGRLLRRRAEGLVALHDKALAELEELSGEPSGEVSIGAAECETVRLLAQAMVKVRERHPRIRFHMYDANVSDVLERIDAGLDDFGLVLEPADLSRYDFLNLPPLDQWALVMRRDHPLAGCTSIRKEDLAGVPLIVPRNSSKRNDLSGWLEGGVDALNVVGTANILHNSELMVEEGFGCKLALADSLIAGRSDRASGLVADHLSHPSWRG